jgi:HEAT repeat protein
MLRMFGRAVRAHQLYMHNNPTYLKALDAVRATLPPIWAHVPEVLLEVTDTQIRWEGRVVLNEPDKTSDALPWVLYKDGIRELRLLAGIEESEIVGLIDVISRVRRAQGGEDDLLTLLWEREFNCIRYRYVDLTTDGVVPLELSDEAMKERLVDPARIHEPAQEPLPTGVVSMDDFTTTLYFLDESEVEYLRDEVRREYASDLRDNVVAVLLDIFEQQTDDAVREELATHLDTLLVHLLTSGRYGAVAMLLREVEEAATRARDVSDAQRARLDRLSERLSEPEPLTQLLQSLEERDESVGQHEIDALFVQLRVPALGTIFAWLGRVQNARVRSQLEAAAQRLAAAHTSELVRLIGSADREVSVEAVRRSGAMRAAAAVPALTRMLSQSDAPVRLAAVVALAEIATPGALQQLEKTLDDPSREVRVASARAFAARMHRPALNRIEAFIKDRRTSGADLTEKMAVFEAYGAMCGEAGIPLLDGMLNSRGLFGKREDAETRACAAMALGRIGSAEAMQALQKASTDKEVLVRNAVSRALRGSST